jgi:GTP-binding protein Era
MQQLEQLPERYGCAFVWQQSVSAVHKTSLELLIEQTKSYLPHEPWMYDSEMISDMPTRFFVQEKVRQQLYLQLNDELPYVCAVYVDQFQQATEKKKTHIQVSIWVEKDSQKPMVIGRKGIKIKDIGVKARSQIEQFLGETIFLGLFVKVKKNWTKSKTDLQYLGLGC